MFFLAAASLSTADRLRQIPMDFWLRLGAAVAILIVTVIVLRKLAQVNKVVLLVVVGMAATMIGFNWIYERNEPAWATPVVRWLADFFPSKGTVAHHRAGS